MFGDAVVIQFWGTLKGDQDGDWLNIYHVEEAPEVPRDTDIGSTIDHVVCGIKVAVNRDR